MPVQPFVLSDAADWPTFKFMLSIVSGIFLFLWAIIVQLIRVMWSDLRGRIAAERKDDNDKCKDCSRRNTKEHDALWEEFKRVKQ